MNPSLFYHLQLQGICDYLSLSLFPSMRSFPTPTRRKLWLPFLAPSHLPNKRMFVTIYEVFNLIKCDAWFVTVLDSLICMFSFFIFCFIMVYPFYEDQEYKPLFLPLISLVIRNLAPWPFIRSRPSCILVEHKTHSLFLLRIVLQLLLKRQERGIVLCALIWIKTFHFSFTLSRCWF